MEENRDPSDALRPGAQGRDLCPSLPPPFEEVLGAPWVGKTMRSPWEGRTYPGDPWGSLLPFIGPTQAFPVNVNPEGNRPAVWYPWEASDLKQLKKAVAEDGPNSLWAETILQGLAHQPCMTQDWKTLCKAVLPSNTCIKWCAFLKEECYAQAERNQAANPAIPVTFDFQDVVRDGRSMEYGTSTGHHSCLFYRSGTGHMPGHLEKACRGPQ